jgi:hypothetical protein
MTTLDQSHALHSTFREKTLEHAFVGELLRSLWTRGIRDAEVLTADVDAAGYDLVVEAKGVMRHIQLKSTTVGGRTSRQKVHTKLAEKPSGCVVWMWVDPDTLSFESWGWFGSDPGDPLPDLANYPVAKHTKGDASGVKAERQSIRTVPKGAFDRLASIDALTDRLFG